MKRILFEARSNNWQFYFRKLLHLGLRRKASGISYPLLFSPQIQAFDYEARFNWELEILLRTICRKFFFFIHALNCITVNWMCLKTRAPETFNLSCKISVYLHTPTFYFAKVYSCITIIWSTGNIALVLSESFCHLESFPAWVLEVRFHSLVPILTQLWFGCI